MSVDPVEAVARAVLYEGYLLYPYRASTTKNRVRWTFGGVHPRSWCEARGGEPWFLRAQCLLLPEEGCRVQVGGRFLHLLERRAGGEEPWQEATESGLETGWLELASVLRAPLSLPVEAPAREERQGAAVRTWLRVAGELRVSAAPEGGGAVRLEALLANTTPLDDPGSLDREAAMLRAMVSTHVVLRAQRGAFVSATDPPEELREAQAACENAGCWPVLVGEPGSTDNVLASAIILEDYPRVAAESPQELFDSTEIDEILTLRILALSDEEKEAMRRGDERARRLLERTEALDAGELMRLHGTVRGLRPLEGS